MIVFGPSFFRMAGLRLLGRFAGFGVILLGLKLDSKASSQESALPSTDPSSPKEPRAAESASTQQVILLSTDRGPARSSEMSQQQQKIAAALNRAGIPNTAGWSDPTPSHADVAGVDPVSQSLSISDGAPNRNPLQSHSNLTRTLILWAGLMLALLGLILLLARR